jgi:hypothetical protein
MHAPFSFFCYSNTMWCQVTLISPIMVETATVLKDKWIDRWIKCENCLIFIDGLFNFYPSLFLVKCNAIFCLFGSCYWCDLCTASKYCWLHPCVWKRQTYDAINRILWEKTNITLKVYLGRSSSLLPEAMEWIPEESEGFKYKVAQTVFCVRQANTVGCILVFESVGLFGYLFHCLM